MRAARLGQAVERLARRRSTSRRGRRTARAVALVERVDERARSRSRGPTRPRPRRPRRRARPQRVGHALAEQRRARRRRRGRRARSRLSTIACMPPLPVPLSGNATRFVGLERRAQPLGDVVHDRAERGVEVADRRLGERVEDALGARARGPSRAAGGRGTVIGALSSGKFSASARAARRGSKRVSSREATRSRGEQLLLARRSARRGSSQRTASRSKRNSTCALPGVLAHAPARVAAYSARVFGVHRAAQVEHARVRVACSRRRRGELRRSPERWRLRLPMLRGGGRVLELAAHVAGQRVGVAGPRGRRVERGELADRLARLLGVEVERRVRHARRPVAAGLRIDV